MQKHEIKKAVLCLLDRVLPRRWITDNFWIRIFFVRPLVLGAALYAGGVLRKERFYEKISAIDDFIMTFLADPRHGRYFPGAGGALAPGRHGPLIHFFEPSREFHDLFMDFLMRHDIRVPFTREHEKLFLLPEAESAADFMMKKMRMRNLRNPLQRMIPVLKKLVVGKMVIFYALLLLFDVGMIIYGIPKNEYYFTFPGLGRAIETYDTPYARRANRIYQRNLESRFTDFKTEKGVPPAWNTYRMTPGGQIAIELNYASYKSLRVQDQNGLTVASINHAKIKELARSDKDRYRRFIDFTIDKRWWEKAFVFIDDTTGSRFNLFDYSGISEKRLSADLTGKIMDSPASLALIKQANEICDCLYVLYHKPNSMKWADMNEIPPVMIRAIILREDRRFGNDLFPVPHRGNDNIVIIPQIAKKLIRGVLTRLRGFAERYGINWLENGCAFAEGHIKASFDSEDRGGSTLSNQVVEMLYTKSIVTLSDKKSFAERQIEQKEHELPASPVLDRFWSNDDILEAYINEVYGGHLYTDIRGIKSQAEMYFMRDLRSLNLREQVMLVAAIKKPTRIKEYAMWLKARELQILINENEADRESIASWEKENATYKVDRGNYREILESKNKAMTWIERRINGILKFLYEERDISKAVYMDARNRQKISFNFAPGIYSPASRLVNSIKREIDRSLGIERSDSGLVVITTIDMEMQRKLQDMIDRNSRRVRVDTEYRLDGQPDKVLLEGGARIVLANKDALAGEPIILNKILADVGGGSRTEDEWDWITLANRSLGSSLKPILDFYFILMGYNIQDKLRNSRVTYNTYTFEQQRIFQNYMYKFPKRLKDIENIEKYWSWSPKNMSEHTDKWTSVGEALVRSVNSVHVQVQEIVTPAVFAGLLNEMMDITDQEGKHQAYRSLILGGSSGNQRYDKFLLAYSIFPNRGIVQKQTYLSGVRLPDGRLVLPEYKPLKSDALARFGKERVRAACLLVTMALREIVKRGTMRAMEGIGAGKTGTSNELRDALATVHFISGSETYIAGLRLGNRLNYSIGKSADVLAAPLLRSIITGLFDSSKIMSDDDFDAFLIRLAGRDKEIVRSKDQYWMKGSSFSPRRLDINKIQEEKRKEFLELADKKFADKNYPEAAVLYESFLNLAADFDSNNQAFGKMIHCHVKAGNSKRAGQLIERFAAPGKIVKIARNIEREYNIRLEVDQDFYSGNEEYERKKRAKKRKRHVGINLTEK